MARPRKYNVTIPGLSCFTDARTKKVYWRYKHPVTGKFHGLGTDEEAARMIAAEANSRLAEQKMSQLLIARDKISRNLGEGISVSGWLDRYWKIQEERCALGEIKPITLNQKKYPVEVMRQAIGNKDITAITVRDIIDTLTPFKERGQNGMAKVVRSVMSDVFQEAQQAGEVSPGFNPAKAAKAPKTKVQRQRLTIDEWRTIYEQAANAPRHLQRAMLLAVVTGQRLGDISNMKFADIWDNHLHVTQSKTGARIAIPLDLRCDELEITLGQVISMCRDRIVSPYLLHHHHTVARAKRGGRIQEQTISGAFSDARDASGLKWTDGTPPTFHEQRSLSERIYRAQGIDTKLLLGHKNQQMTDKYNDDRGREWTVIAV
ncbi:TPA: phage integrase Arm DNA-binding domain-containing protein [Serratia marcescens]|uniref:Integrase n=1 Tax=Serratia marcescens TaxID=615 RepID=A0A9X8YLY9_SERMA|nr:phage integrase Arm DNA-binding domain-containing protein [Serratia marcescens]MBS3894804.1 phage integrase Arm DNA-binding domain-containing protein [Serratia marcescens]HBC7422027.1 phage integrase Arm DNA-binding domain-containing protein [Serratia marcescens]